MGLAPSRRPSTARGYRSDVRAFIAHLHRLDPSAEVFGARQVHVDCYRQWL